MDWQRAVAASGYFMRLLYAMKHGIVGERQLCDRLLKSMGIVVEIRGGYYAWPGKGKGQHGMAGGLARHVIDRYTKAEIASGVGYTTRTIERWIKQGLLTPYRINHKIVHYSMAEALDLVRSGRASRQSGVASGQGAGT
jgi:hypothetical protein